MWASVSVSAKSECLMTKRFEAEEEPTRYRVIVLSRNLIYDRSWDVCETLGGFRNLTNLTNIDRMWEGYSAFKSAVISNSPAGLSLRDRDRYLWGKSFRDQLTNDVATAFRSASEDEGLVSGDAVE